jgi:hypothetical protein
MSVHKRPLITAPIEGTISRLGRINQPSRSGKLAAATVEAELWANAFPNQAYTSITRVVEKLYGAQLTKQNESWAGRCAKRAERASRPLPGPWEVDEPDAQEILNVVALEDLELEEPPNPNFIAMVENWLFLTPAESDRFAGPLWRLPAPQVDALRVLPPRLVREFVWRTEQLDDALPSTVSAYCRRVLEQVSDYTDAHGKVNFHAVWASLIDGEAPIAPDIDPLLLQRVAWTPTAT